MQRRPVGPQGDVIAAIGSPSAPAAKADSALIVTDPSLFGVRGSRRWHFARPITSGSAMACSQDNLVLPPDPERERERGTFPHSSERAEVCRVNRNAHPMCFWVTESLDTCEVLKPSVGLLAEVCVPV